MIRILCRRLSTQIPESFAQRKKSFINQKDRKFIDLKRIVIKGGNGGNGCVSFNQHLQARFPRRDGADGGTGGRVIISVDSSLSSLNHIVPMYVGGRGGNGTGGRCIGAVGSDVILPVPPGTLVKFEDGETVDMDNENMTHIAAKGGAGGMGNVGRSEDVRPEDPMDPVVQGIEGTERKAVLELKTIADVGLVGLPNAGKSTLLTCISRAHPRVAPYPFTTLNPHLGMVEFGDTFRFTVADIPGLAIGANDNVGLGHAFLRHIERCKILVYILDMSGEMGALNPVVALRALQKELRLHKEGLVSRKAIVVANKMDRPSSERNLEELRSHTGFPVVPISARIGSGVLDVTGLLRKMIEATTSPVDVESLQREEFRQFILSSHKKRT